MVLKKIEVQGFKSFADKTTVHFEGGVTAIVGPNGCGKSNVSDSIRWVLGERSAKMLRGSEMQDLIFSGTEYRKPVGLAEVSLTFDNSKKLFPVEYEEVVITRRLFRSGESEYLINKTPCRYKDIQSLILDTGVGSSAYSMIEQGRIDYIVSAKPDERRFLIEEAAGISKYKVNKEEAIRKLQHTEENLVRLQDIVVEVERNIKYAEKQAKRAEKYKLQYDELKELEIVKAIREQRGIRSKKENVQQEQQTLLTRLKEIQTQIQGVHDQLLEIDHEINEFDNSFSLVEEKRYFLKSELSTLRDQSKFKEEKIQELNSTIQVCEEDLANSVVKIQLLEAQVAAKEKELKDFSGESRNLEPTLNQEKEIFRQITEQLFSNQKNIQSLRNQLMSYAASETETHNALYQRQAQQTTQKASGERLAREEHDLNQELSNKTNERVQIKTQYEALLAQHQFEMELIKSLTQKKSQLTDEQRKIDGEVTQLLSEKTSLESKLQVFTESQSRKLFSHDRDELIKAALNSESSIRGLVEPFSQHLRIKSGFERAILSLLESQLQSVLCKSSSDLKNVLSYIREKRLGSLTLLIQNQNSESQNEKTHFSFQAIAATEVAFLNAPYNSLLISLLQNTWIVENLEVIPHQEWLNLATRHRFVSKEGEILGFGTQIQIPAKEKSTSVQTGDEISKITQSLTQTQEQLEQKISKQRSLSSSYEALLRQLNAQENQILEQKKTLTQLEESLHFIDDRLERITLQLKTNRSETQDLTQNSTSGVSQLQELEQKLQELTRLKQELTQTIHQEEDKAKQWSQQKEEKLIQIAQMEALHKTEQDRFNFLKKSLADQTDFLKREHELVIKRKQEKEDSSTRIKTLKTELEQAQLKDKELEQEHERISEEIIQKKAERLALLNKRNAESSQLTEFQKQLDSLKEKEHQMQLTDVEIGYQENAIRDRLLQIYKIDLNSLDIENYLQKHSELSDEQMSQTIEELKGRVDSLGTVNLLAVEEYEELKTRYDFLTTQKQDIEQAREALLEAIRKINRTTRKLFEDTFNQVKINFQEYFQILFGGGQAQLVLEDEQNPLESGIEIMVRPAGKKLQSITLLSGGEKALTATALLFALFKIKPSPFSVLDEIDAPLDEANIDRFLTVLRQFLGTSQFIIITHNRKTIAMADSLYGVTMEEPGVSKIVSVRLGQTKASTNDQLLKETSSKEVVVNTENL